MSKKSVTEHELENLFEEFPPIGRKEWEDQIRKDLKKEDLDFLKWRPYEDIELEPFYVRSDIEPISYITESLPGFSPFVRGFDHTTNNWVINELVSAASVEEANRIARKSLEKGGESITFESRVSPERKILGVPLKNLDDMSRLLEGIEIEDHAINFQCGVGGVEIFSLFIASVKRRINDLSSLNGVLFFDPLSELALKGRIGKPFGRLVKQTVSLLDFISSNMPLYKGLSATSFEFHEAGSNAVQELAFTLAKAVDYLVILKEAGLSVENICKSLSFDFCVGSNYLIEIAKFRAFRILWANIVQQFGIKDLKEFPMVINARTSLWNKTIYDPYVNMLRTTVEGISAVLGGCDSLFVVPFDQLYEQPTDFSRRMARNVQLIIKEECFLEKIVDPACGAYHIEVLTDKLVDKAFSLFLEVEKKGGYLEALKSGFIQSSLAEVRSKKSKDIQRRKLVLIGTNQYPNIEEVMLPNIKDNVSISDLSPEVSLEGKEPLCVDDFVVLFEKGGAGLADVFSRGDEDGENIFVDKIEVERAASVYEKIRLDTERFVNEGKGKKPRVFLLKSGDLHMSNLRASFSLNFFGCAGFEIVESPVFDDPLKGVDAAVGASPNIVVLCSSDPEYIGIVETVYEPIKERIPSVLVVVAGYPKDSVDKLVNMGVDDFIYAGCNAVEELRKYQRKLGIIEG